MKLGFDNLQEAIGAAARRFMLTESEWNPKVFLGRTVVAVLPEGVLHRIKRHYYAFLIARMPDDWQEQDASLLKYLVHTGDAVLDIGASIGGFTKLLSGMVGPAGRVYSFEPNPPTYDFLSYNIKRLELRNVELFNLALSDKQGSMTMVTPRYRWGSECHYDATLENDRAEASCRRTQISVTTMDSVFCAKQERITFIKCDVNYHELACLSGGIATFAKLHPALLVEVLPNPDRVGSPAARVFELMASNGYAAYWFDGTHLRKRQPGERSQNYFFLTPEHLQLFPAHLVRLKDALA